MNFNCRTGKFEIEEVVTKEIDPVKELVKLSCKYYYGKSLYNEVMYAHNFKKLNINRIGIALPPANKDWARAVLSACLDFVKDKPGCYISAYSEDVIYPYSFVIKLA